MWKFTNINLKIYLNLNISFTLFIIFILIDYLTTNFILFADIKWNYCWQCKFNSI